MTNLENQITEVFATFDKDYLDSIPAKCEELSKRAREIYDNYEPKWIDNHRFNPKKPEGRYSNPRYLDINISPTYQAEKECGKNSLCRLDHFIELETKQAEKNQKARNQKIVKALQKHNIESIDIPEAKITWGNDFETDVLIDDLVVTIKIIFAGGYNIQRGHFRTLVKVRKA